MCDLLWHFSEQMDISFLFLYLHRLSEMKFRRWVHGPSQPLCAPSRNASLVGEALRDDPSNGCKGDNSGYSVRG